MDNMSYRVHKKCNIWKYKKPRTSTNINKPSTLSQKCSMWLNLRVDIELLKKLEINLLIIIITIRRNEQFLRSILMLQSYMLPYTVPCFPTTMYSFLQRTELLDCFTTGLLSGTLAVASREKRVSCHGKYAAQYKHRCAFLEVHKFSRTHPHSRC
jgi:hypothetical protein